jgi:hypothetical protein
MANTFKVVSHDVMPATSGTPEALYATPGSTTTVVIGLILANIHTAQVTASVILVSDTSGGGRAATNTRHSLPKTYPFRLAVQSHRWLERLCLKQLMCCKLIAVWLTR